MYIETIILGMLAAAMPPYFAMDHTQDREVFILTVTFFCVLCYSSFTKMRRKHFDNTVDITQLALTCLFCCCFFSLRFNADPLCASLVWYHRLTGVAKQLWTSPSAISSSPPWQSFCSRCTSTTCWLPVTSLLWSVSLLRTSWTLFRFIKPDLLHFNHYFNLNSCLVQSFQ